MKKIFALTLVTSTIFLAGCCTCHNNQNKKDWGWDYSTGIYHLNPDPSKEVPYTFEDILTMQTKEGWECLSMTAIPNDPQQGILLVSRRGTGDYNPEYRAWEYKTVYLNDVSLDSNSLENTLQAYAEKSGWVCISVMANPKNPKTGVVVNLKRPLPE